jgi:hypothetical protein
MPAKLKEGRDRLSYKGDPVLIDLVKAAAARDCRSVSSFLTSLYVRAVREAGFEYNPGQPPPRRKGRR